MPSAASRRSSIGTSRWNSRRFVVADDTRKRVLFQFLSAVLAITSGAMTAINLLTHELIDLADAALYHSKDNGKNQVTLRRFEAMASDAMSSAPSAAPAGAGAL